MGGHRRGHLLERALDDLGDAGERDPPVEERRDGDLVGGVEHARRGSAGPAGLARQAQAREGLLVGRLEGQLSDRREVEPRHVDVGAVGMVKRVGDRHPHVGMAEVGERGPVVEAHHRVDDRLRVDDDVDALVGDAEEVMCLDHLEALVEQRRRVDRDLAAHVPGRVRERLLARHVAEVAAAAEGPARRGQHEPVHRARRLGVDQLVERRVLGVHGNEQRPGRLGERGDQLAADHEALLVGEREVDALGQRDDRRAEPRRAEDRVEHHVGARRRDQLAHPLLPRQHLAVEGLGGGRLGGVGVGERDSLNAMLARLLEQVAPCRWRPRGRRPPARPRPARPRVPGRRSSPSSPGSGPCACREKSREGG